MNEAQFRQQLQDQGYGEVRVVEFEPNRDGDMHAHDFSAMVMVTKGELTLRYEDGSMTYGPGDWCEVAAGTRHAECSGPDGATALAAAK
jgi:quercetin dioxygenase-like cupin family protein